jgi:hypothetical protein
VLFAILVCVGGDEAIGDMEEMDDTDEDDLDDEVDVAEEPDFLPTNVVTLVGAVAELIVLFLQSALKNKEKKNKNKNISYKRKFIITVYKNIFFFNYSCLLREISD